MGRWLAALRNDEKKIENATSENPQNPQNLSARGFEGFEGSASDAFAKNTPPLGPTTPATSETPSIGFEGFEGSLSGRFKNFYLLDDRAGWDDEEWQVAFDERAAILEFDGCLSREEAERLARQEIDDQRKRWIQ